MKPKHNPLLNHTSLASIALTLGIAGTLFLDSAQAQTVRTWDGGGVGGTVLNTATNWSNDTAPSASGDTARWNGTVGGNLALTYNAAFGNSTSGVSIDITGAQTGSLQIGATVTNADAFSLGSLTIAANAGAFTFGNGSGNDRLTFRGTNTLTNDSANTATFASDVVFFSGGGTGRTLAFGGSGNWQVDAPLGIGSGGAGSFNVTKSGTGTLTLTGANTYTGSTTINAGTLSASNIVVSGGTSHLGSATTAVTLGAAATQGTLSYTGNNAAYTRGFTIGGSGGGRLDVTTSGQTLQVNTAAVTGSGLFTVGGAGNTTINANLTHTGGLTKADAGTLTITGTGNTYAGATNVNAGTLVVNGNISTSAVTVASGATIGGSGSVGALSVQSGAFVGPGNSPGILTVNGNYNQAGTLVAEITGLSAGSQYDQLDVRGAVNLSGALSLNTTNAGNSYALNSMMFLILNDSNDAITGAFSNYIEGANVGSFGGFDWVITYFANGDSLGSPSFTGGNDVALRAIPEPSATLLGGLGVLGLLRRRRPSR
jgi:fibronectin-binding autotransporter adhesin